jgi:tetratricopeptide (TPR) repeat protein
VTVIAARRSDRRVRAAAVLSTLLLALGSAGGAAAQELPPVECVAELRRARLEAESGDAAAGRARTERAVTLAGCEMPALAELIRLLASGGFPVEDALAARSRLLPRLADPATPLPPGLLRQLAAVGGSAAQDRALVEALEARLAGGGAATPAAHSIELLEAITALEERHGRLAEARAAVGRLLVLDDADSRQWRALELDYLLGRWIEVADRAARLLERPGTPNDLRELLVTALAELGRYDEMLVQLELLAPAARAAEEGWHGRYVGLLLRAAWALRDAGRDEAAAATFRRVLEIEPENPAARLALLHLYGSAEERAEHAAVIETRRELETDPQSLFEEGSQLLAAGDLATARELLARAAPGLAGTTMAEAAWYNLGLSAFRLERWGEAADAFAEAASLNPAREETQFQRGVALYHAERCGEAIAPLLRALELRPDRHDAHYFLAACHAANGDTAASARHLEIYRRSKPGG